MLSRASWLSGRRLKVLHCIPALGGGGAERQVSLLAPLLASHGVEVHVAARFADGQEAELGGRGVTCHPLPRRHHLDPRFLAATWHCVRRVSPDLVHTWLSPMIVAAGAAASVAGIPWVLSECSGPLYYRPGLKERLRQAVGRHAAAVVASGLGGLEVWPAAARRALVPSAVDLDSIVRARPTGDVRLRGRFVILSACRLIASKRVDLIVEAIASLVARVPEVLLVLLGDGPERTRLEAQARRLGIADRTLFLGHRGDVARWMKDADLFVSASEYEGLPTAVIEAAAAGTSLLLSDIPAHLEAAGVGALFVAPTPAALAEGAARLYADADLRRRLAGHAAGHVRLFSADLVAGQLLDAYRMALGEEAVPGHSA